VGDCGTHAEFQFYSALLFSSSYLAGSSPAIAGGNYNIKACGGIDENWRLKLTLFTVTATCRRAAAGMATPNVRLA